MRNGYVLALAVTMIGTIVILAVIALSGIALLILARPGGQEYDDGPGYVQAEDQSPITDAPQRRPWRWR